MAGWLKPVQGFAARPVGSSGHFFAFVYSGGREFPEDPLDSSLPTLVEVAPARTLAEADVRLLARLSFSVTTGAFNGELQLPRPEADGVGAASLAPACVPSRPVRHVSEELPDDEFTW